MERQLLLLLQPDTNSMEIPSRGWNSVFPCNVFVCSVHRHLTAQTKRLPVAIKRLKILSGFATHNVPHLLPALSDRSLFADQSEGELAPVSTF